MYLITGATGTVGRPLLAELRDHAVRAVTRDPSRLPGAVTEPDVTDVTALFLHPRAVGLGAAGLLARAKAAGVRRVVVLSAINVDDPLDEQPSRYNGDRNTEVEAAAIGSGLEWVSLRAAYFAINTAYSWSPQLRAGDVVRAPFPRAALTGPESLTQEEMVATIGRVLGRDVRFEPVPAAVAAAGMVEHGHPPEFVAALMARYERENGMPAHLSGDVEKVLGRPARSFADWVSDHAEYFR